MSEHQAELATLAEAVAQVADQAGELIVTAVQIGAPMPGSTALLCPLALARWAERIRREAQ